MRKASASIPNPMFNITQPDLIVEPTGLHQRIGKDGYANVNESLNSAIWRRAQLPEASVLYKALLLLGLLLLIRASTFPAISI